MDVVQSIGTLEQRLEVLEFIYESFNPVWPHKAGQTNQVMRRIGTTFLPELAENEDLRQKLDMLVSKNNNHFKNKNDKEKTTTSKVQITQELLLLVYLPMIGF